MPNGLVPASATGLPYITRRHLLAASAKGAAVATGATALAVIPAEAAEEANPFPPQLPQSARDAFIRRCEAFGADDALTALGLRFQLARSRYLALEEAADVAYREAEERWVQLGSKPGEDPDWIEPEGHDAAQREVDQLAVEIERTPATTLEGFIWKSRALAWNCGVEDPARELERPGGEFGRFARFIDELNKFVRTRQ